MLTTSLATAALAFALWNEPEIDPASPSPVWPGTPSEQHGWLHFEVKIDPHWRAGYYRDSRLSLHLGDGSLATSEHALEGWIAGMEIRFSMDHRSDGIGIAYDHAETRGKADGLSIRGREEFLTLSFFSEWNWTDKFRLYGGFGTGIKFARLESDAGNERDFDLSIYAPLGLALKLGDLALRLEGGLIGEFDLFTRIGVSLEF